MTLFLGLLIVGGLVAFAIWHSTSSSDAKQKREVHARLDAQLVCPHCMAKGHVVSREVVRKKGVSGGKATGALMTGGVSMLATGLSRKEPARRLVCGNCGSAWDVA